MGIRQNELRLPQCTKSSPVFPQEALERYIKKVPTILNKSNTHEFDLFVQHLLNLKTLPTKDLSLRLYSFTYSLDSSGTPLIVMTTQGSSMIQEVNPIRRSLTNARNWIVKLTLKAEEILEENGLPVTKAGDLVRLTSAWDIAKSSSRKSMGLDYQLEAIRLGYDAEKVLFIERQGIPVQEYEEAIKLPLELRYALYPHPKLYRK